MKPGVGGPPGPWGRPAGPRPSPGSGSIRVDRDQPAQILRRRLPRTMTHRRPSGPPEPTVPPTYSQTGRFEPRSTSSRLSSTRWPFPDQSSEVPATGQVGMNCRGELARLEVPAGDGRALEDPGEFLTVGAERGGLQLRPGAQPGRRGGLAPGQAGPGVEDAEIPAVEAGHEAAVGRERRLADEGVVGDVARLALGQGPEHERPGLAERQDAVGVEEPRPGHALALAALLLIGTPAGDRLTVDAEDVEPVLQPSPRGSRTAEPSGLTAIGSETIGRSTLPSGLPPKRSNRSTQRGWPSVGLGWPNCCGVPTRTTRRSSRGPGTGSTGCPRPSP